MRFRMHIPFAKLVPGGQRTELASYPCPPELSVPMPASPAQVHITDSSSYAFLQREIHQIRDSAVGRLSCLDIFILKLKKKSHENWQPQNPSLFLIAFLTRPVYTMKNKTVVGTAHG